MHRLLSSLLMSSTIALIPTIIIRGLTGLLGLFLLMVIHEAGHYFAARAFGMRVTKFSIGIAPILWKFTPKGSPTTFQIGAIPFFAYVQIAGMNPLEEVDPNDKGSYANASLIGRIVTIFAGSFSNYVIASVFFFAAILISGQERPTTAIKVMKDSPAAIFGLQDGDRILQVDGNPIRDWEQFRQLVSERPERSTPFLVQRNEEKLTILITPKKGDGGQGRIGAMPIGEVVPVPVGEAMKLSLIEPANIVKGLVTGMIQTIKTRNTEGLGGPPQIIKIAAEAASRGAGPFLGFLGALSANLAGFNLLPIPALDGGRLIFLIYEALSRRRPNAVVEAHIHLVGFLMLFALMIVVSWNDIFGKHLS